MILPPVGSHATDPFAQSSTWTCAYCGQSNAAGREGCRSCQAPRPEESDEMSMEIRVFGGESITAYAQSRPELHPVDTGWDGYLRVCAEQGSNKATQRTIIERVKLFVGLR